MITVTIKWGTDGEVTKTYHFTNKQQYKWFMKGVDEAEGWLKYEIVEDEDDVPKWRYTKKRVNSWEVKDDLKNRILEKEDELPPAKENKPEAGKIYALTGGPGSKCIANGNSWAESAIGEEVKHKIEIIENTTWTTEVEAKSKKDAIKKAEDIHMNGTTKGGGRDAMTFEHYTEEDYKVVFK